jgi:hypothetical protein
MKFTYIVKGPKGQIFNRLVTVKDLDSYFEFIDHKNAMHRNRATGWSFHAA